MARLSAERWRVISPYLDQALELSPAERDGWLVGLRRTEPDIAEEVAAILAKQDDAERGNFLGGVAADLPGLATLAGQTLGPYTLEKLLGQGGMGSVWLARRSDGRYEGRVAIKLLNAALISSFSAERFRLEGSLLARLDHPNIARLLDAGVSSSGQPYLVLEYVEGSEITTWCDERHLGIGARVRLFCDVLAAVAHAHSHLIVHRDIKPANVWVNREGVVKLLDFGVAKLIQSDGDTEAAAQLTRDAGRAYTPGYAAPEQFLGQPVTTATDVYSLGVLLYAMLSGRNPTGGASSPAELLRSVLEVEPRRVSVIATEPTGGSPDANALAAARQSSPHGLRRALEGDLDNVVAKALEKEMARRYASAADFAADLRHYLAGEPVSARPDTFGYRTGKFLKRNRVGVALAGLVAATLTGAAVFAGWQAIEAQAQREAAEFQLRRAEAFNDVMSQMLQEVAPDGRPLTFVELLDRAAEFLDTQYRGDDQFLGHLLVDLSSRFADIDRWDRGQAVLAKAQEIAERRDDPELLARVNCSSARHQLYFGKATDAPARLEVARAALARLDPVPVGVQVTCLRAYASEAQGSDDPEAAVDFLAQGATLLEKSGNDLTQTYASVLNDLGGIHFRQGNYGKAWAISHRVLAAYEKGGRGGTVAPMIIRGNLATILVLMGEPLAAEQLAGEQLDRVTRDGTLETSTPSFLMIMARPLVRLERWDEATPLLELADRNAAASQSDFWRSIAQRMLGEIALHRGQFDQAEERLVSAIRLLDTDDAVDQRRKAAAELTLAELRLAEGRIDDARQITGRLLTAAGYPAVRDDGDLAAMLQLAARVALAAGDPARAAVLAGDALKISAAVARDPVRNANVGEAELWLAEAHLALGDGELARSHARRSVVALQSGVGPGHRLTIRAGDLLARLENS